MASQIALFFLSVRESDSSALIIFLDQSGTRDRAQANLDGAKLSSSTVKPFHNLCKPVLLLTCSVAHHTNQILTESHPTESKFHLNANIGLTFPMCKTLCQVQGTQTQTG